MLHKHNNIILTYFCEYAIIGVMISILVSFFLMIKFQDVSVERPLKTVAMHEHNKQLGQVANMVAYDSRDTWFDSC